MSSSVGTRCLWVGRGHPWALDVHGWGVVVVNGGSSVSAQGLWVGVIHGCLMLVGGGLLSSIGVSAVWCHICGQSRSSMGGVFAHL